MRRSGQIQTIFHVLLSWAGFLLTNRLAGAAAGILLDRRMIPVEAWVMELAAFLAAVLVFLFLYRRIDRSAVPKTDRYRCGMGMAFVHVGYGFFWLLLVMVPVLMLFPAEGDPVREPLLPRILTAVCIHPLPEEILFRRICMDRLLTLSEMREERETVPMDGETIPGPPENTKAGMLFAVLTQALLFALVHTGSGGMLYGFGGGVVLGVLMLRTGRLWVPTVCHMLANLRSVTYPYLPVPVTYGLDVLFVAVGLTCGVVFRIKRRREAGRKAEVRYER